MKVQFIFISSVFFYFVPAAAAFLPYPNSHHHFGEDHCDCEDEANEVTEKSTPSSSQPPIPTETTPKKEIPTTPKPTTTTESLKTSTISVKPEPTNPSPPWVNQTTTASPTKHVPNLPCPTNPHCGRKCGVHKGSCDMVGYMPHPSNCHKFLQCVDQGEYRIEKFEFECPNGAAWDQTKLTCDHEHNVKACYPNKEEFKCPGDGFFADPNDCGRFYHCVCRPDGSKMMDKYHMLCAPGTSFDDENKVCNFSHLVKGCGAEPVPCEVCQ